MEKITLAHGGGGKLMHQLIDELFIKELNNTIVRQKKDSAVFEIGNKKIAFTTDSYVVNPIFFPGGDIGSLAVHGTVNDLAVCGARALYLALGLIVEEGIDRRILERITYSIKRACRAAKVKVVTGDLKVVERGSCDKIYINASGIGEVFYEGLSLCKISAGDVIMINGPIGEHAVSVLSKREGIAFRTKVRSDSAPLDALILKILRTSGKVRFMRDPTRGGVATTLNEIAAGMPFGISMDEEALPVSSGVREACELLGYDPLYLACEGRVLVVVGRQDEKKVLNAMRRDRIGRGAVKIGEVVKERKGKVYLNTASGGKRMIDMLTGEQLPRIC